jgi:uncharacterized caspase-like protein
MGHNNACGHLLVVALVLLILTTAAVAERRTALVIGNAAYDFGPLRNPVNDATDIAAALRQLGFEVTLQPNADLRVMHEAIETFSRQLRQGGAGLFYFAGHGVQVGGENYLIPIRARISRWQDVQYEAVPVGRILGGMEDAENHLNIIILDACRDNPWARQWRSSQRGLAMVQAAQGSLIAFATAPGGTANDGDGRNGLYTSELLQHLTTPGLSVEQLFKRVRAGVVEATKGKQMPWESSSLIGDFFFASPAPSPPATAGGPVSPSVPAPAGAMPAGPDPEATMWALIESSAHAEDLMAFLNDYPNGRYAPAARLKLQQLQRLAEQQQVKTQRLAEQERQQRERAEAEARQRAEVQRREEERQRLEAQQKLAAQQQLEAERRRTEEQQRAEAQRREEEQKRLKDAPRQEVHMPQADKNPVAQQLPQVARLEPESKLHEREAVAVPAATLSCCRSGSSNWERKVSAFHMDLRPVSNREFLAFVKSHPQWKKSHIGTDLHDGDYLKRWEGDEAIKPAELDRPVSYVSFYAALAYCENSGKDLPKVYEYRVARDTQQENIFVKYEKSYNASKFNFMSAEWTSPTSSTISTAVDSVILYSDGTVHDASTQPTDKKKTGRSLGFRCVKRSS